MQQYDLLSRFSVHFEQPRAVVIISYSSCGTMCPGWVNRIDAAGPCLLARRRDTLMSATP